MTAQTEKDQQKNTQEEIYNAFKYDYEQFIKRRHPEVKEERKKQLFNLIDCAFDMHFMSLSEIQSETKMTLVKLMMYQIKKLGELFQFDAGFKDALIKYYSGILHLFTDANLEKLEHPDYTEAMEKTLKHFRDAID